MGRLEIIHDYRSTPERTARTLRLYLPDLYERAPDRRFPVLYLQDGQNLFRHPESALEQTWEVDRVMDEREQAGLEPWIVVAVDHRGVKRLSDYAPWDAPAEGVPGRGRRYAEFMAEQLKPHIDRELRTRREPQWTAVGGSSMGGLISLYLGLTRPDLFGRIAALSPSVMWAGHRLFDDWTSRPPLRIYLDAGARESIELKGLPFDYGSSVAAFHRHLRALGYGDQDLRVVLEAEGQHSERDWSRRLPAALRWLLDG